MVKIFAKLIKNHKTVKSYTYINVKEYSSDDFYGYVSEICNKLDISTPIIIPHNRENYEEFNMVKFVKEDFVDTFNYDFFLLENVDR